MPDHPKLNMRQLQTAVFPDLLISIAGPVLIYHFVAPYLSATDALLLAGLLPLIRIGIGLLRRHRLNLISVFALLTIALKILFALVFKDARLVLVSDSLITAVYGLLLLASLFTASPLLMRLAEGIFATASSVQNAQLIQRWQEPAMRRFFTIITTVWGVGMFVECAVSVMLAWTLPIELFLLISPIVHYGFLLLLLLWAFLFRWLSRSRKRTIRENMQNPPADEPASFQSHRS